jgi:16S rRNA (uracil1498-N3)-methyltransferase
VGVPVAPPLFFVEDIDAPVLSAGDRHHAARVLRIRHREQVTVSDGRGQWRSCWFGEELGIVSDVVSEAPIDDPVTVGFALTKSTKPEFVVQKLTEVGVDRILPFASERSIVRWEPAKADARRDRWQVVAREAAMQSRRAWLPTVAGVATFEQVAVAPAVLADLEGRRLMGSDRMVLVGPEGGWTDAEREVGLERVCLGPGVLRAETAAVVSGAFLASLRG